MTIVHVSEFVAQYGYLAGFGLIFFQTIGIPMPGEAALIAAAVYAQHTHKLDVVDIILVSALATCLGGIVGYWIGRRGGYPVLMRHGHHVGLTAPRMRLGEYLFQFHGGKILLLAMAPMGSADFSIGWQACWPGRPSRWAPEFFLLRHYI